MGTNRTVRKGKKTPESASRIHCVDVFCGVGGLTHGLVKSGVSVAAGIDCDPDCRYPYEANNPGGFVEADVSKIDGATVLSLFPKNGIRLLAGCAPCQPFSNYSQGRDRKNGRDWGLLAQFGRLVREVRPHLVTMENVPQLERHEIFQEFVDGLSEYNLWYGVVDCSDYGVPQSRQRLVLLGSRLGGIDLLTPEQTNARRKTVRAAIGRMPKLGAGESDNSDAMHAAAGMSPLNLERIRKAKPGGTWKDWPESLRTECHTRASGTGYGAVYGRMEWHRPAPTMTTLCHGFGNGRFGHPEQHRAISLREAAILQSFPRRYKFVEEGKRVSFTSVGRMIGNAVPPKLGEVIGRSLIRSATRRSSER